MVENNQEDLAEPIEVEISWAQLEEDLNNIDYSECKLSKAERKSLVNSAHLDILDRVGRYIDDDKLVSLYPGLDLNDLGSYDFTNSKIKIFIVPEATFEEVVLATDFYEKDSNYYKSVTGLARGHRREFGVKSKGEKIWFTGKSERPIIAVRELIGEDKESNSPEMRQILRHELLHVLGVGQNIPNWLAEGVIEFYALDSSSPGERVKPGYENLFEFILKTFQELEKRGVRRDVIDKAFISEDQAYMDKVTEVLNNIYGEKNVAKLTSNESVSYKKYSELITKLLDGLFIKKLIDPTNFLKK